MKVELGGQNALVVSKLSSMSGLSIPQVNSYLVEFGIMLMVAGTSNDINVLILSIEKDINVNYELRRLTDCMRVLWKESNMNKTDKNG